MNAVVPVAPQRRMQTFRLPLFFALAFLLSWYPWLIALARGRTTGPNPLGPLVAALIVAAIVGGRREVAALLGRIIRARVGWCAYAFVALIPVLLCGLAALIASTATGMQLRFPAPEKLREMPDRFLFILLFIALGEEPGWRGFALPGLQRAWSPVAASCILAVFWAVWHAPLFGNEFALAVVPAFVVSLFGATMVQTWLFNRTRGSVLLQMLLHATVNSVAALVLPLFSGGALLVFWWTYAALWLAAGIALSRYAARPSESAELSD